ncbi:hypothetical protein RJ639_031302 [Escallonia herrerae]|uniref:Interactor of constitutive active ROPs 3-like n=1 Tax=Escallonia herrerae TaxID=1293975 RepID=A0AA89BB41_9ASTE|nr:hypothetical protein RJ639_031302 [Escallonia herrerae]
MRRKSSVEVPQKVSPRAVSSEASQRISPRAVSSEAPQKISPRTTSSDVPQNTARRAARQLKTSGLEVDTASSSNQINRTPKTSPKVNERRSQRSPAAEIVELTVGHNAGTEELFYDGYEGPQHLIAFMVVCLKKRLSRHAELETQISQLQEDLKKAKDQIASSESWKKQAQQDAEESKKQLLAMSSKLEEPQQLLVQAASEDADIIEGQKNSREEDTSWQSELEAVQKQHSVDLATLTSAVNKVKQLELQLEMVAQSEAEQTKQAELANSELHTLKEKLAEALLILEDMKDQLRDCKQLEAQAQALVGETLLQLETAKKTVETLRSDGIKATEAYEAIAFDLDQSRTRISLLEGLVNELKANSSNVGCNDSQYLESDQKHEPEVRDDGTTRKLIEAELKCANSELENLRSALETAEVSYHEERIRSAVQITSSYELVEQIKSTSSLREAELEAELKKSKVFIEELKSNLMDKETELQGICEENEDLNTRLENTLSSQREHELENDFKRSKEDVEILKANLMDKETKLQNILEENGMLKQEIRNKDINGGKVNDEVISELEAARTAEREALMKLGYMMEEADKSNRKVTRVSEQLEAAQMAISEIEAELRRVKVQSDQWRKAAEAAAAMLSTGNNGKFIERTGSLDINYSPVSGKISSPYSEDMDDDYLKKKNGNMLKRIGVLWKKPQK